MTNEINYLNLFSLLEISQWKPLYQTSFGIRANMDDIKTFEDIQNV